MGLMPVAGLAYRKSGRTERTFKPVGFVVENAKRDTGETFLTIKLDFPVAVTGRVAFQRKPRGRRAAGRPSM